MSYFDMLGSWGLSIIWGFSSFTFCLTICSVLIRTNRDFLSTDRVTSGCLSLFLLEVVTCLMLPTNFASSVQCLLTISSGLFLTLCTCTVQVKESVIALSVLALCRIVTLQSTLPSFLQLVTCYGGILGADLFISYLEQITNKFDPDERRESKDIYYYPNELPVQRTRSRISSVTEFLGPSIRVVRRRFSSLGYIWSRSGTPNAGYNPGSSTGYPGTVNGGRLSLVPIIHPNLSGGGKKKSGNRRVSLPSFQTPRASIGRDPSFGVRLSDPSALLIEADGLLADLFVEQSPVAIQSIVRAVRRLIQTTVQSQMAQQYASISANIQRRRKSTMSAGIFQKSFEDDLSEMGLCHSPYLGHTDYSIDVNSRLRTGGSINARRLSATLWTTTTSATGMPTLVVETGPTQKKNRPQDRRGSLARSSYLAAASSGDITAYDTLDTMYQDCICDKSQTDRTSSDFAPGAVPGNLHSQSSRQKDSLQEQPSRNSRSLSIAQSPDGKNDSNVGNVLGVPPDQLKQLQESVRKSDEHDVFEVLNKAGISREIMEGSLIASLNVWNFPIFDLESILPNRILTATAFKVFDDCSLFDYFSIDVKKFIHFFSQLEDGYWAKNTYHTRTHAADVMQGVYYLTTNQVPCSGSRHILGDFKSEYSDETTETSEPTECMNHPMTECALGAISDQIPGLEHMSLLLAAAMHDYDHPGRTNAFLVDTGDPLAILYNDRSVLENHHAASSWRLLMKDENDFLTSALDSVEFKRLRFLVLETILATDLKKHFDFLAQMKSKLDEASQSGGPVFDWTNEADRIFYSQLAIKIADIGGPAKRFDIHYKWTEHICEEFYQQGDDEARRGLPVSNYMSRSNPQVPQLQESFITHMVGPLCELFESASLIPVITPADENSAAIPDTFKLRRRSSSDVSLSHLPKIKITSTNHGLNEDDDAEAQTTTSSAKKCLHSTVSMNTAESIVIRQIRANLAHWQEVIEREQKSAVSASSISPVEEQIDENDDILEDEPLHEILKEIATSESAAQTEATMLESNDVETFTNVTEKPFSPSFDSLTAVTYQTPKIYLTHTENLSNSDSTNNYTTSNSESVDSFTRQDGFSTSNSL